MRFKNFIYKFRLLLIVTVVALIVIVSGGWILTILYSKLSVQSHRHPKLSSPIASELAAPTHITAAKPNSSFSQQVPDSSPTYYGHFAYKQADSTQVMTIASYASREYQRFELLAPEAGKALMKMIYAAREESIWIIPVSGFRTIEQQQKLFDEQIKRRGSVKEAAKVSAPPKYSEHHTGYAVDLADGHFPKQDITLRFEKTDAYRWLTRRAQEFGFELSFYKNNPQGVSYEPWHWRYVASPEATAIFAQARKQQ